MYGCTQYFGDFRATLTVSRPTADIKYLVFGPNYDLGPKATPEVVRYNVVPEPATLSLLSFGLLGLVAKARSRRQPARRHRPRA